MIVLTMFSLHMRYPKSAKTNNWSLVLSKMGDIFRSINE